MLAKTQGRSHLLPIELVEQLEQRPLSTARRVTAVSADLAACYLATDTRRILISQRRLSQLSLPVKLHTNLQCLTVDPAAQTLTWQIQLGGLFWTSSWLWVLRKIKLRKMQTLSGRMSRKNKQRREQAELQMSSAMQADRGRHRRHRLQQLHLFLS